MHSQRLRALIKDRIETGGGQIGFDEFMRMALYEPGLGYYVSGARKFGQEGDFITAPEMGDLFGRCTARQCRQVLNLTGGDILEFGAGSGALSTQILSELTRLRWSARTLFDSRSESRFASTSARTHREKDFRFFAITCPGLIRCRKILTAWLSPMRFLDAMPVVRFRKAEVGFEEMKGIADGNDFVGSYDSSAQEKNLFNKDMLDSLQLAPGYESEVNHHANAWLSSIAQCLHKGVILLIDYGFPRNEFYHPDRSQGTLMCHYQHCTHENPFINVGLQDITAHVDFTALAQTAVDSGLDVLGYTTQAAFLMSLGILDSVDAESKDTVRHLTQTNQIKKLTMPSEMGELF